MARPIHQYVRLPKLTQLKLRSAGRLVLLGGAVGLVAGFGALAFDELCRLIERVGLQGLAGYDQGGPGGEGADLVGAAGPLAPFVLLAVLAVGGLVSGLLVYLFAPEAEGHGTDAAVRAYHHRHGVIRARVPVVKMLASAITLGTGGSGGREGPIAQIGAGFGSFLATRLHLTNRERRMLMLAGIGAGIGAIFRAPLAGAIFAVEVLYIEPEFEAEALIPSFLSTTIAYSVFCAFRSFTPLFAVAPMRFDHPELLLPFTALALAVVVVGWVYVKTFYGIHEAFRRLPGPKAIRPMIGAVGAGLVALAGWKAFGALDFGPGVQNDALSVLSFGYGFLQKALAGDVPSGLQAATALLLFVAFGKIVTTSLTIGSGGSAGVFGPSMVIGGAVGAVVGLLFQTWMPGVVSRIDMFVILGMAGFFSAVANTPVSSLIMVSEMTGSYALLLPSMWVCALSYLLGRGWSIYKEQVDTRADSPAHRGDFVVDVLRGVTVREVLGDRHRDFEVVPQGTSLHDISHHLPDTDQICFPVVDDEGSYVGAFGMTDVRRFLYEPVLDELAVAFDLVSPTLETLTLQTDLSAALGIFARSTYDELPVVDTQDPTHVVALLRRRDVLAAYERRARSLREESDRSA